MSDRPTNLVVLARWFISEGMPLDPVKHLVLAVKAEQQKEYALADEWAGKRYHNAEQREGQEAEAQYHRAAANALNGVLGDQSALSMMGLLHESDEIIQPLTKPQVPQRWRRKAGTTPTNLPFAVEKIEGDEITLVNILGRRIKLPRWELLSHWYVVEGPGAPA